MKADPVQGQGPLGAVDVLTCGHRVFCTRKPGGRVVVPHQEPCEFCDRGEARP